MSEMMIYQHEAGEPVTVRLEGDTLWLTQRQISELLDTSTLTAAEVRGLAHTPGGAFGSCRLKLKSLDADRAKYERLLAVLILLQLRLP